MSKTEPEQVYFPRNSLQEALKVPKAIWEKNAGNPFAIADIAEQIGHSPTSSTFRELLRSSQRYGLTSASWQQDISKTISIAPLGLSIVAPSAGEEVNTNLRKALETPSLFRAVLSSISGKIVPPPDVFKNTLVRVHKLSKSDADACYTVLEKNIRELGISQELQGKIYLRLDRLSIVEPTRPEGEDQIPQAPEEPIPSPEVPKRIFVAHGKNRRPLEQLKTILTQFKVPFEVAIDETHKGRPISAKVAELMKSCTSGIFIFTADEETTDPEANKVSRPSDNVVFELGAGTVLYGNKIVIFREEGVSFGSDFTEYGHITFERDKLDAKAFELMKELIGLGFLTVSPT